MSPINRFDLEAVGRARREVVRIAREVMAGERGVIAASRLLSGLAHDVVPDWRDDHEFRLFGAIDSETDDLPLEDMRPVWDAAAFAARQAEVQRLEAIYRADADAACQRLIDHFGGV